jgi:hypothetical protein
MHRLVDNFNNRQIGTTISRVLISLLILKDLVIYFLNAGILFGPDAIQPIGVTEREYGACLRTLMDFFFHTENDSRLFISGAILLNIFFLLGLYTRISGLLLFFCLWMIRSADMLIMDGADNVLWIMLPLLSFTDSTPLWKHQKQKPPTEVIIDAPSTFLRDRVSRMACLGIVLQLCLIYFFTAAEKLAHTVWLDGTALYYILRLDDFRPGKLNINLTTNGLLVAAGTYLTVVWEASFPFLIWFTKGKKVAVIVGLILHLAIFILLRIDNFSFVMLSLYPILFTNQEFIRLKLPFNYAEHVK